MELSNNGTITFLTRIKLYIFKKIINLFQNLRMLYFFFTIEFPNFFFNLIKYSFVFQKSLDTHPHHMLVVLILRNIIFMIETLIYYESENNNFLNVLNRI